MSSQPLEPLIEKALRALGRPHNGTVVGALASSFRDQWFDSQEDLMLGKTTDINMCILLGEYYIKMNIN